MFRTNSEIQPTQPPRRIDAVFSGQIVVDIWEQPDGMRRRRFLTVKRWDHQHCWFETSADITPEDLDDVIEAVKEAKKKLRRFRLF